MTPRRIFTFSLNVRRLKSRAQHQPIINELTATLSDEIPQREPSTLQVQVGQIRSAGAKI